MKVFYSSRMVAEDVCSPSPGKPPWVVEGWREAGIALEVDEPEAVTVEELALAHERGHVEEVLAGRKVNGFGNFDREVAASVLFTNGAMLGAARWAVQHRWAAAAPCSGFHHAEWDRAMMFCTFNGLMVTACKLREEGLVRRVGILDCDQHFGNGTEDIIRKVGAEDWVTHVTATRDYERNADFLPGLPELMGRFGGCEVLLYQAGADPHVEDPFGGFLTTEELAERDRIVFTECRRMGLPVAWNLAGGYQDDVAKVVEIHVNTGRMCEEVFPGGFEEGLRGG